MMRPTTLEIGPQVDIVLCGHRLVLFNHGPNVCRDIVVEIFQVDRPLDVLFLFPLPAHERAHVLERPLQAALAVHQSQVIGAANRLEIEQNVGYCPAARQVLE